MIKEEDQIKTENSTLFIKDLEMHNIFKDTDIEEGNNIIDKLVAEVL